MTDNQEKQKPDIYILFDTNILRGKNYYEISSWEFQTFINNNKNETNISIHFVIPDLVIKERHYQIVEGIKKNFSDFKNKLDLLEIRTDLSDESIEKRMYEKINNEVGSLGLEIIKFKHRQFDWEKLIEDSVKRNPPFIKDDENTRIRERGFRDAIIGATFLQFLGENSEKRALILTNDRSLNDFLKTKLTGFTNIQVCNNISMAEEELRNIKLEIEGQLEILGILPLASKYFFDQENKEESFFNIIVKPRIIEDYGRQLNEIPDKAAHLNFSDWEIEPPITEKIGEREFLFTSKVKIHRNSYKKEYSFGGYQINPIPSGSIPSQSGTSNIYNNPPSLPSGTIIITPGSDSLGYSNPYIQIPQINFPQNKNVISSDQVFDENLLYINNVPLFENSSNDLFIFTVIWKAKFTEKSVVKAAEVIKIEIEEISE